MAFKTPCISHLPFDARLICAHMLLITRQGELRCPKALHGFLARPPRAFFPLPVPVVAGGRTPCKRVSLLDGGSPRWRSERASSSKGVSRQRGQAILLSHF
jgi:hypothetical protein